MAAPDGTDGHAVDTTRCQPYECVGGHHVPLEVVRRRFDTGLRNFWAVYCKIVDRWAFYDGSIRPPRLIVAGSNT